MAGIGTADVTYTVKNLRRLGNSLVHNRIQLAFGDSAKTYSAGGIPLVIGNLGCPNTVQSLVVVEQSTSGYKFQYDSTANKLIVLQSGSHTHNILLKNAAVADSATSRVNAGANLLGAGTGSDITVTGGGANGGVVATTIGALAEATSVALAAQTIICEVIGF